MNVSGIQNYSSSASSSVYPNPATSYIVFLTSSENAKYAKIYDVTGRSVSTVELTGKTTKTDLSSYENGMYIYVIVDEHGNKLSTSKFNVAK
jgi:hypothetical protein